MGVSGFANVVKLRETPRDMAFMEMLTLAINLKCASYSMHPTTINIREQAGGGVTFNPAGSEEFKIGMAQEQGFHSLVYSLCEWLTREIIKDIDDEMVVVPINLEKEDKQTQAQILQARETMTVDEKRKEEGLPPIGDDRGERLASQIGTMIDGAMDQKKAQEQWAEQQSAMQGGGEFDESGDQPPAPAGMQQVAAAFSKPPNVEKANRGRHVVEFEIDIDEGLL